MAILLARRQKRPFSTACGELVPPPVLSMTRATKQLLILNLIIVLVIGLVAFFVGKAYYAPSDDAFIDTLPLGYK